MMAPTFPRSLFLFAHPDDEYGVLPHLEKQAHLGPVVVMYLTDGGRDVALLRQRESTSVLARLGIPTSSILWTGLQYGIGDGQLVHHAALVKAEVRRVFATHGDMSHMFVPAWEGGHPDHDAAHAIAVAALQGYPWPSLNQFSLYHCASVPRPLFRAMSPLAANGPVTRPALDLKDRLRLSSLCLRYPSQWQTWIGLFLPVACKYLSGRGPVLQPVDSARCLTRPHAGTLYYERRGFAEYSDIQTVVSALFG